MTIPDALAGLGCPVCHPPYRGGESRYVTYQLLGQASMLYAEGKEQETSVQYAVNTYAPEADALALALQVKAALEDAGYIVQIDIEFYESAVRLHRFVLTAAIEGSVYG